MAPKGPVLRDASLLKQHAFIDGHWVEAKSGNRFDVEDPASGSVIGSMPEMNAEDTKEAIAVAAKAFASFRKSTARERARLLRKWYQLMMENLEDLSTLITWENGKPLADARAEVLYAAQFFEWFSEEAPRIYGETIQATDPDRRTYTIKQPVGVCGLITPWNWPAGMVTRKVGAALAAGCTVVLKAPAQTPLTSAALAELGIRAGIPSGVVNIVTAHAHTSEVGTALTSSEIVKKISFTGSTRVGKILMKQAASTLKKTSFELGGNAPFLVFDDADLEETIDAAVAAKFKSSGEICTAANRIYVQEGIYDTFAQGLLERVKDFKVGPGYDKTVTHGPLIHDGAVGKCVDHTGDAVEKGGKILIGGQKMPGLGSNFFEPTIIGDMNSKMYVKSQTHELVVSFLPLADADIHSRKLAHEETFGPIAGLFPFKTEAEAVALANDTDVGLAGYFFSRNIERCYRVAEALEVGMVGINTGLVSDVAMPFGGVKESGFGREGSKYGVEEYLTVKAVTMGNMGKPLQDA